MTRTGYSAVLTGVHTVKIQEFNIPTIGPDDASLRVEMAGVCGSDAKFYQGQRRTDIFPIILGHEILGHVAEIGTLALERMGVKKGDRVIVDSRIPCGNCAYCRSGNHKFCSRDMHYGHRLSTRVPPSLWLILAHT